MLRYLLRFNEQKKLSDVRIALGTIGPVALRCRNIENSLIGKEPLPDLMNDIYDLLQKETDLDLEFGSPGEYRVDLASVVIHKALEAAVEHAKMKSL